MFGDKCWDLHVGKSKGDAEDIEVVDLPWSERAGVRIIVEFAESADSKLAAERPGRLDTGPMRLRVVGGIAAMGGDVENPQRGADLIWEAGRWVSLVLPARPEASLVFAVLRLEQSEEHPGLLEGRRRIEVHESRTFTSGPRHQLQLPGAGQVLEVHLRAPDCLSASAPAPSTRVLARDEVVGFARVPGSTPQRGLRCCTFDAPNGLSLNYGVYLPPGYAESDEHRWPLLVFFHSMHGRLDGDNSLFYESDSPLRLLLGDIRCPKALRERFVVLSPQCPGDRERGDRTGIWLRRGWYDSSKYNSELEEALKAFIEGSLSTLRVDRRRVVAVGSSMGAYAALELAGRWPGTFAALGLAAAHYDLDPVDALVERVTAAQRLPLWFTHARNDCLCPFGPLENLVEKLKERSTVEVRFTTYDDTWSRTGHRPDQVAYWSRSESPSGALSIGDELFEWLAQQMLQEPEGADIS